MTGATDPAAMLATFATVAFILLTGHGLADHVLGQTDRQANGKCAPDRVAIANGTRRHAGWGACLRHVGQYHLVLAALMAALWAMLPLHLTWIGLLVGFAWSAVSHAFLDRRWPVRWLLEHTGSGPFAHLRAGDFRIGMYLSDQALHKTALLLSAVAITRL